MNNRNRSLHQPTLDPLDPVEGPGMRGSWLERRNAIGRVEKQRNRKPVTGSDLPGDPQRVTRPGAWW